MNNHLRYNIAHSSCVYFQISQNEISKNVGPENIDYIKVKY